MDGLGSSCTGVQSLWQVEIVNGTVLDHRTSLQKMWGRIRERCHTFHGTGVEKDLMNNVGSFEMFRNKTE